MFPETISKPVVIVAQISEIVSVDKTVKLFLSNIYIRNLYISCLFNFGTFILNGPYVFVTSVKRAMLCLLLRLGLRNVSMRIFNNLHI